MLFRSSKTFNEYVVKEEAADLKRLLAELKSGLAADIKAKNYSATSEKLSAIKAILDKASEKEVPNFFRMGYYLKFSGKELPDMPVAELNEFLLSYLNENFMLEFLTYAEKALKYSALVYAEKKKEALAEAAKAVAVFSADGALDKKTVDAAADALIAAVEASIDRLEINKDSIAYTFHTSLKYATENYFNAIPRNEAAQKAHDKQQAKYDALCAKGKKPDWKVIPAALINLDDAKKDIVSVVERLVAHYENLLSNAVNRDFAKETVALVDFLKLNASETVYKVTKSMAKHKAIKLMEEVGIPEARMRYNQYPFEFSGGMRQRIVIAIALSANPDILICDEPTTALDVTIQAQILDLINNLKKERNLSVIFITHDLGVVANVADKIGVMYAGKIV